jgi:hypothetical protein
MYWMSENQADQEHHNWYQKLGDSLLQSTCLDILLMYSDLKVLLESRVTYSAIPSLLKDPVSFLPRSSHPLIALEYSI